MNDEEYMLIAYNEALKAIDNDDVPIGAIIVKDGEIIAKSYNKKELHQVICDHAEMLVIKEASQKLGTWHLDGCILYCTLEPCMMCSGAIIQSRIQRVVYAASSSRWDGLSKFINNHKFNHYPEIVSGVLEEKCQCLLSTYFKQKRM